MSRNLRHFLGQALARYDELQQDAEDLTTAEAVEAFRRGFPYEDLTPERVLEETERAVAIRLEARAIRVALDLVRRTPSPVCDVCDDEVSDGPDCPCCGLL